MDRLKESLERIDALTVRERGMILLACLAVALFVWDSLFMSPLDTRQKRLQAELDSRRAEINALNIQFGQLIKARNEDPDAANRAELKALRAELAQVEKDIRSTADELVDPVKMPELLRTVINRTEGLTLRGLEGLGVSPLVETDQSQRQDSEGDGLVTAYKHGMRIRFHGDYLQTLEYLRKLEELEWGFFWDSIEFKVDDYPQSLSEIRIYTLSLTKDWIKA